MKKLVFLLVLSLFSVQLFPQTQIRGVVKSADNNENIPFVIIKMVDSKIAFAGDENGAFSFKSEKLPVSIIVSSIGYSSETITINSFDSLLVIKLNPSTLNLSEVKVYASKGGIQASSLETLKSKESYNLAGTTKDIFRSIQMLPGVSSNNAASAQYNVRGGTFDENLMLINGIEVSEPYHIKVFPMASIGIFNIDLVQRIDFSSGGFSAEYGDALSSVLNVDYKKARTDSFCGRINLGLIDLGVVTEIPVTSKSSLLIGARRSYLDPVVQMIDPDEKVSIKYYDLQSKFDYEFNSRNKISLLAIYSEDMDKVGPQTQLYRNSWSQKFNNKTMQVSSYQRNYWFLDANYNDLLLAASSQHKLSGRFILNSSVSYYREYEKRPIIEKDTAIYSFSISELFNTYYYTRNDDLDYTISNLEFKMSGTMMINSRNTSKIGVQVRHSDFDYSRYLSKYFDIYNNTEKYPDTINVRIIPSDIESNSSQLFKANTNKYAAYINHTCQVNSKLVLNGGIRADYYELNKQLTISPRTSMAYNFTTDLKGTLAWGIFNTTPKLKQTKFSFDTTGNTKSQQAIHYIAGIEKRLSNGTFKLEAYFKEYDNLLPVYRSSQGELLYKVKDNTAEGYALGLDFQYVITLTKIDFWFNYSLASAKEKLKGTSYYYSRYSDQRHTLSSLAVFKLRKKNEVGIKLTYGSGYAYQILYKDIKNNQWVAGDHVETAYLPYYMSLDLRYKKEFNVFHRPLQFYVDITNVLNRKNAIGHRYRIDNNGFYEEDNQFLGILPTFGLIYDF